MRDPLRLRPLPQPRDDGPLASRRARPRLREFPRTLPSPVRPRARCPLREAIRRCEVVAPPPRPLCLGDARTPLHEEAVVVADDTLLRTVGAVALRRRAHPRQSAPLDADVLPVNIPIPPDLATDTASGAVPRVAVEVLTAKRGFEELLCTPGEVEGGSPVAAGCLEMPIS